jgi:hypothetical protein
MFDVDCDSQLLTAREMLFAIGGAFSVESQALGLGVNFEITLPTFSEES